MIKITADSTCDLSKEILYEMDITLTPLVVMIGEKAYHDGVDIVPADIFRYVECDNIPCKTAAINAYEYERFFEAISPKHEAVIHICIGSSFSSCYQNALLAAQEFENVYVVDSQNLSSGSGHLVYEAAKMARADVSVNDILCHLKEIIPKVDSSFIVDQLDYLYRGGRCSGLEMYSARILQIKPCIEVSNGRMIVGKKYSGSFKRCLEQYVKDKLCDKHDIDYRRVFITHPMCSANIVEDVKVMIQKYAHFDEMIETNAGCTISCHCGPNTLGILFLRKESKCGS
ncbi:MAG: DegV family protein [Smithellaceae bacterium]|jgi:DegV family protein with EDD domain|nr:DegV family protein [Smithellaceae bacterium]